MGEKKSLKILYDDSELIAVMKPAGLLVHPSKWAGDTVTCMSLLRDSIGEWVYPVHRLDRQTSGVLLFGRSSESAKVLSEGLGKGSIKKTYHAWVRGWLEGPHRVDSPVPNADGERVPAVSEIAGVSKFAIEEPLGKYPSVRFSFIRISTETGRYHQVRRHSAHLRHPLLGDAVYGDGKYNRYFREKFALSRLQLHASVVEIPGRGKIVAPAPEDFLTEDRFASAIGNILSTNHAD